MDKDFMKVIMNPVRQRILQYLIIHGEGTTKDIGTELSDIPTASLYRHIKMLHEHNCIEVVSEKKLRGTIERTWKLVENPMGEDPSIQDVSLLVQKGLLSLMTSFQKYLSSDNPTPEKDLLSLSTSTILMTDEEFMMFMQKIGNVYNEVIYNQPAEGRKPRRLTFISSPCEEE